MRIAGSFGITGNSLAPPPIRSALQFVCFSERTGAAFTPDSGNDPRQDDYDIWLGTNIIKPWIAHDLHSQVANYLYLDGHAATLRWDQAVVDMYPDKDVLVNDGSYP